MFFIFMAAPTQHDLDHMRGVRSEQSLLAMGHSGAANLAVAATLA
jgi:hypothetical protein